MRLLAKTAEERYQTAAGLEHDLRRCLTEWQAQGRIDDFPLGEHDLPDRLLIPEKLYGREHEVAALLAAFDRVASRGAPELVLVSGYSGIGKSSVVNELHKVAGSAARALRRPASSISTSATSPTPRWPRPFRSWSGQILTKSEARAGRLADGASARPWVRTDG